MSIGRFHCLLLPSGSDGKGDFVYINQYINYITRRLMPTLVPLLVVSVHTKQNLEPTETKSRTLYTLVLSVSLSLHRPHSAAVRRGVVRRAHPDAHVSSATSAA